MEVYHKKHRHHIKVEKDAEEEEVFFYHTLFSIPQVHYSV